MFKYKHITEKKEKDGRVCGRRNGKAQKWLENVFDSDTTTIVVGEKRI